MNDRRPNARIRLLAAGVAVLTAMSLVTATAIERPERAEAYTTKFYYGAGSAPVIGAIGDSTFSGVRWYNNYSGLYRYNFVYDAESCRRTIYASCRGREGYAPENVLSVMRRLEGRWGRVLVLMTGYNDPGYAFDDGVDAVIREARSQGIQKVVWLTLRTADVTYVSPDYRSDSYTFRDNNRILLQKAVQYRGYLQIADWATYSARRSDWVGSDGVHLSYAGTTAVTNFIADNATRVLRGKTITPPPTAGSNTTWTALRRGDYGSRVVTLQRALIDKGFPMTGGADGDFGAYTEHAVIRFQRSRGLEGSGVVGPRTAELLGIYRPPPPEIRNPTCTIGRRLVPGDVHSLVTCLEQHLVSHGFNVRIDRRFERDTADAVAYFKAVRGGSYDGVTTLKALSQLGAYRKPPAKPNCRIARKVQLGDQLHDVACLRKALQSLGFDVVDSEHYSDGVDESVQYLREMKGMRRRGSADERLLRAIGMWEVKPERPGCTVSRGVGGGDDNNASRCLKRHLRSRGFNVGKSTRFDRATMLAVRYVERGNDLKVDGYANENVMRVLGIWQEPSSTTTVPGDDADDEATATEAPPTTTPATVEPPATTTTTVEPPPATTTATTGTTATADAVTATSAPVDTSSPPTLDSAPARTVADE